MADKHINWFKYAAPQTFYLLAGRIVPWLSIAAVLFALVGLYLGTSSVASGFGALGSLVVLIAWVYCSAQVFLLGAEYTWVYANQLGSRAPWRRPIQ